MLIDSVSSVFNRQTIVWRTTIPILVVCFLAPALWANVHIAYILWLYKLINFVPVKVTFWGVLGCYTHTWMYPVVFFANGARLLLTVGVGYTVSKKGFREQSVIYQLAGALLLFPVVMAFISMSEDLILRRNPLWFIDSKAEFRQKWLPIFGSFYEFKWAAFVIANLIDLLLYGIAYQVVFNVWTKAFRRQVLSGGFVIAILGFLVWYVWLGPILYR